MQAPCEALEYQGIIVMREDSMLNSSAYLFKPYGRLSLKVHKRDNFVDSDFNFFHTDMFEF